MTTVLNEGEIRLVQASGNDLGVAHAARVSYGTGPDAEWRGEKDEKLIRYLAKHDHLTPFEHNSFTFYVDCPLFVRSEWHRHRTFSYNEISGRYKKLKPKFYIPDHVRIPDPDNKQGSLVVEDHEMLSNMQTMLQTSYEQAYDTYNEMVEYGIAREIARSVLPVGIYTQFYATGNFRNWMHFCWLRTSRDAQYEIRVYAEKILEELEAIMPVSVDAFLKKFKGADQ